MAQTGDKVWRKYGALDYREFVADDLQSKFDLPFPKLVKLKRNETVVFSYITYKAHRDSVNKKVMADPMMDPEKFKDKPMPFDEKRTSYGGFKAMV
jgi:uncharacterized protein YbaA (DUF1428 family)